MESIRVLGLCVPFSWQNRQFETIHWDGEHIQGIGKGEQSISFGIDRVYYFLGLQHILFSKWWRHHSEHSESYFVVFWKCISKVPLVATLQRTQLPILLFSQGHSTNCSNVYDFFEDAFITFFQCYPQISDMVSQIFTKPGYLQPLHPVHLRLLSS